MTENTERKVDLYTCKYAKKNKLWWANTCRNIIQIIRSDIGHRVGDTFVNEYSRTLFMNYRPIVKSDSVCEKKKINFPKEDGSTRYDPVKQDTINCYANAAVDTVPFKMYQYFKEISICPTWTGDMMVFKCKENECVILEWVDNEKFSTFDMVPENMIIEIPINVQTTVMMSMLFKNTQDIEQQLWHYNQLIRQVIEAGIIDMLCDLVIGARAEYENKFIEINEKVYPTDVPLADEIKLVLGQNVLEQGNETGIYALIIKVPSFTCHNYNIEGNKRELIPYTILSGLKENSIILAKPLPIGHSLYEPLEIIFNLKWEYIINFNKYF